MHRSSTPQFAALFACAVLLGAVVCAGRVDAQQPPTIPASAPALARNADQAAASVQSFYDKSTTFRSDFQQKFWVKAYNHEKSSRGHVTFAKPGKMDWVYDDPKDNRVVSDGNVIRVYEAGNKQMYEQPVDKSQ